MAMLATSAKADFEMRTGAGYGIGKINTETSATLSAVPLTFAVTFEDYLYGKTFRYSIGGIFQHQIISYPGKEGAGFDGSNAMTGVALGWRLLDFSSSFLRVDGAYYPFTSLAVTSETSSTVNDATYSHSTLTTLTGSATEAGLTWFVEETSGQFNKYERLRYGIQIMSVSQSFKRSELKIATSNPDLAPRSTIRADVSYSLSLVSVSFLVGFAL